MQNANAHEGSLEQVRARVVERLRARRPEIEEAIFARVRDTTFGEIGCEDIEYATGLRTAVAAAVELGLMGIQRGEPASQVPSAGIEQARRAARFGVSLDTVLRRYIAGQGLLTDFIMEEAGRSGFSGDEASLHHHLRETQTPVLERLTASVIAAYSDEIERMTRSPEHRRAELVLGLLAGSQLDAVDSVELDYDFDVWHIGVIASGRRAAEFARGVKEALGCERLAVLRGERTLWIWFGRRRKPTAADIKRLSIQRPAGVTLAIGEPRRGMEGWRLTHREAQAALSVALRKQPGLTRCSDVLLEAAVLQHKALATSLVETFLSPLDGLGHRGQTACDTLRAYFESKRNVSSTANRLGVARKTVESRLREIQLEVALLLEALDDGVDIDRDRHPAANLLDMDRSSAGSDSIEQFAQSSKRRLSTLVSHSHVPG
jgi:hypothetical protein